MVLQEEPESQNDEGETCHRVKVDSVLSFVCFSSQKVELNFYLYLFYLGIKSGVMLTTFPKGKEQQRRLIRIDYSIFFSIASDLVIKSARGP